MKKHNLERKILGILFEDMRIVSEHTGLTNNELFVGYLRQPINVYCNPQRVAVQGTCALTGQRCSYLAPHNCYGCEAYKSEVLNENSDK